MTPRARERLLYAAAVVWALLTLALAAWWMVFGLLQAKHLGALQGPEAEPLERVQRMLVWEGITLIGLILCGGLALVVSVYRERVRMRTVESFFMAFTHDLKTALASLQVQAESLREDLVDAASNPNLQRLLADARRLRVQLENSLYFARPDGDLMAERVDLATTIERIADDWPELSVNVGGNAIALADTRAVETVFRNLFQNADVHGGATAMSVQVEQERNRHVRVTTVDNGRGASADVRSTLGRSFARSGPSGGTGVGLFVSRQLALRMRGDLSFPSAAGPGLTAVLTLLRAD